MVNGADCKLKERLKTAIEPLLIKDASAVKKNVASWLADKVIVRGKERKMTFLTLGHWIVRVNLGRRRVSVMNGIWIAMWKNAPKATPTAKPAMPKISGAFASHLKINLTDRAKTVTRA